MAYTPLLGLSLPVTGTLSGTWGDEINNSITSLLDSSVAGTTTLSTDADVTLTTTTGSANQARAAVLLCTGARTGVRYITAPAQSKTYTVVNATTGGFDVYIRGVGPTAGIAVPSGYAVQVAWNSSDFVQTSVPVAKISGLGTGVATALAIAVGTAGSPVVNGGALGTPSSGTLTNATGLPIASGVSGLGTGVATALAVNVGTAGSPVVNGGALGTPSSGTVTNLTGTASININGTVGATTPAAVSATSLTDSGNLTFTGTAQRITGDFSNATTASRLMLQTSTVNGPTGVIAIPNGSSNVTAWRLYNASDTANSSIGDVEINATSFNVRSFNIGTGTYLPMIFQTGGSERVRVDTSGNVGIGTSSGSTFGKFAVSGADDAALLGLTSATGVLRARAYNTATTGALIESTNAAQSAYTNLFLNGLNLLFGTGNTERMRIDTSGNVTVSTAALLGYGTGSGGTVTQATSKSTAVALNKPTGQITMNNAALAAGAVVSFTVTNSLVSATDVVVITINFSTGVQNYNAWIGSTASTNFVVNLKNITAVSLSEAVVLNFAIIKGATS